MFSIPKYGWINISIGSFSDYISDVDYYPVDKLIDWCINYLQHEKSLSIEFDNEEDGWELYYNHYYDKAGICVEHKQVAHLTSNDVFKLAKEILEITINYPLGWEEFSKNIESKKEELLEALHNVAKI